MSGAVLPRHRGLWAGNKGFLYHRNSTLCFRFAFPRHITSSAGGIARARCRVLPGKAVGREWLLPAYKYGCNCQKHQHELIFLLQVSDDARVSVASRTRCSPATGQLQKDPAPCPLAPCTGRGAPSKGLLLIVLNPWHCRVCHTCQASLCCRL